MASQITSLSAVYSTVYSRRKSKKTSKLLVTGLCAGNSLVTGEFPAQSVSNMEYVSISWRHHETGLNYTDLMTSPLLSKRFHSLLVVHSAVKCIADYEWNRPHCEPRTSVTQVYSPSDRTGIIMFSTKIRSAYRKILILHSKCSLTLYIIDPIQFLSTHAIFLGKQNFQPLTSTSLAWWDRICIESGTMGYDNDLMTCICLPQCRALSGSRELLMIHMVRSCEFSTKYVPALQRSDTFVYENQHNAEFIIRTGLSSNKKTYRYVEWNSCEITDS